MIAPTTLNGFSEERTYSASKLEEYFRHHMNNGWSDLLGVIATNHGVNPDLLEDMKNEVIVHLLEKRTTSHNYVIQNLDAYLKKVFTNQCRLYARRDALREDRHTYGLIPPYSSMGDKRQQYPLEEVALREQIGILYIHLDRLSKTDRTVLILHYIEGFSIYEVAELLDIPEGTAKSRINRGLANLRKNLENV